MMDGEWERFQQTCNKQASKDQAYHQDSSKEEEGGHVMALACIT